jgi:hypothetical protein
MALKNYGADKIIARTTPVSQVGAISIPDQV